MGRSRIAAIGMHPHPLWREVHVQWRELIVHVPHSWRGCTHSSSLWCWMPVCFQQFLLELCMWPLRSPVQGILRAPRTLLCHWFTLPFPEFISRERRNQDKQQHHEASRAEWKQGPCKVNLDWFFQANQSYLQNDESYLSWFFLIISGRWFALPPTVGWKGFAAIVVLVCKRGFKKGYKKRVWTKTSKIFTKKSCFNQVLLISKLKWEHFFLNKVEI